MLRFVVISSHVMLTVHVGLVRAIQSSAELTTAIVADMQLA